MSTDSLVLAIIGHLVGDYLLQNDWMAMEKKRNPMVAVCHAYIWTASVTLFSGWLLIPEGRGAIVALALLITHFVQDHTMIVHWWMKLIGQEDILVSVVELFLLNSRTEVNVPRLKDMLKLKTLNDQWRAEITNIAGE